MAMAGTVKDVHEARPMTAEERKVIIASSAGTVFEWYDFYLAGSLAANIAQTFVPGTNDTAKFIFVLFGFAAAWPVVVKVFKASWSVDWSGVLVLLGGATGLATLGGLIAAALALSQRPAPVLRGD